MILNNNPLVTNNNDTFRLLSRQISWDPKTASGATVR